MIRIVYMTTYALIGLLICAIAELFPDELADCVSWKVFDL